MANKANIETVKELNELFAGTKGAVLADYRGLTAMEMLDLRRQLKSESAELHVIKNTLARIAIAGTPIESAVDFLNGPISIALSYGDVTAPARIMAAYEKKTPNLKVKGGVIDCKPITADDVKIIATLPSKEVLIAKLLATLNAPVTNFAGVMAAVIRKLIYALKEIGKKKG